MRFLLVFLLVTACSNEASKHEMVQVKGVAMTIPYVITLAPPYADVEGIVEAIQEVFNHTHKVFDHYNPDSEISQINQSSSHEITISAEMERLFKRVEKHYLESVGRYDPSVATVGGIWKRSFQEHRMPQEEELENLRAAVGWKNLTVKEGVLHKKDLRTQIDLSGIAKGDTVDQLVSVLKRAGCQNFIVDWGGEIAVCGKHPSGRAWRLFISALGDSDPKNALAIVEMQDEAIATSGNYLQQWELESEMYTHIIDPRTLKPLKVTPQAIGSASVKAASCADADAMATTLMLFDSVEEAKEWAKKWVKGFEVWVVTGENSN